MPRLILFAGIVLMFAAPAAAAGPFGGRHAAPAQPVYAAPSEQPVYAADAVYPAQLAQGAAVPRPLLAKFALVGGPSWAPGAPPSLFNGGLREAPGPHALRAMAITFTYIGTPFNPIGLALPPAIRVAHVILNGTPYPGRPVQTALWVASPIAARARDWVHDRRGGN